MKNLMKNLQASVLVTFALIAITFSACKKDQKEGIKAAPLIEGVQALVKNDTTYKEIKVTLDSFRYANVITKIPNGAPVTSARWNSQYRLVGKNLLTTTSVTLNGVAVYFNPAFLTETNVIFTVGNDVPYGPAQPNKLKVTTKYGTVDYDFSLQQPTPVITSVSPLLGEVGNVVTIVGTYFENLKTVKFGEVTAEIVGIPSSKEIKVKIPAGITQARMAVTTDGGTTLSTNSFFAFKKILYEDSWATGMSSYSGWGGTGDIANTTVGVRGAKSIKFVYTGYDCPLQFAYGAPGPVLPMSNYTALKLSIYGGPGTSGKTVKIQLNSDNTVSEVLTLTEGAFADYVIPLAGFKGANFTKIWVVENSNYKGPIYIDEIGLL